MKHNKIINLKISRIGFLLLMLFSTVGVVNAAGNGNKDLTASEAFAKLPLSVMDMIDKSRRLDMLDYYEADSIVKVPNTMNGVSYLEKVTPDYLKVHLTPVSTMTIKILPSKKGEIIMIAYTVGSDDQAYDTDLRFFDTSFNELKTDKYIREAALDQFFNFPDRNSRKEVTDAIPFPTIRYIPDVNGTGISAELTVRQYMSQEERILLEKYRKPSGLKYSWNGSKFDLEK